MEKNLTIRELKNELGENFRSSQSPLWKKAEKLNEPLINSDEIKSVVMNGRTVSFFDGHKEIPIIYVRSLDTAASYAIHKTIATRDTPAKFGGYTKNQVSVGLYAA